MNYFLDHQAWRLHPKVNDCWIQIRFQEIFFCMKIFIPGIWVSLQDFPSLGLSCVPPFDYKWDTGAQDEESWRRKPWYPSWRHPDIATKVAQKIMKANFMIKYDYKHKILLSLSFGCQGLGSLLGSSRPHNIIRKKMTAGSKVGPKGREISWYNFLIIFLWL